ncbi:MAG: hypothetical protein MUF24_01585 [Chitinophagaceae bacterium]|jgi:hypothetical protein|nr:hypothetical protein [Chitinophagaceae bacterium]
MKNWILKNKLALIGAAAGAIGGYIYYAQVGCNTGTCAITGNPVNSTIYFSVMGALAFSALKPGEKKEKQSKQN